MKTVELLPIGGGGGGGGGDSKIMFAQRGIYHIDQ